MYILLIVLWVASLNRLSFWPNLFFDVTYRQKRWRASVFALYTLSYPQFVCFYQQKPGGRGVLHFLKETSVLYGVKDREEVLPDLGVSVTLSWRTRNIIMPGVWQRHGSATGYPGFQKCCL